LYLTYLWTTRNPLRFTSTAQLAKEKRISIYDYGTAGLERNSQLPGALIVLMDKIDEIKKKAALKGKATKIPLNCLEVLK